MSHRSFVQYVPQALVLFAMVMFSTSAAAIDCQNPPPLSGISLTPPSGSFAGSTDATLTLNFGGSLPPNCFTNVALSSTNFQAANPGIVNGFQGSGPFTMPVRTFAVNVPTTVTISAFSKTAEGPGTQVGPTVTATMTLQPLPLTTFSVDRTQIQQNETATGRVELGGGTGGLAGLARVNLTAAPANAVTIPAFVDVGNQATPVSGGLTEYVSTFTISPRAVAVLTNVTITASRAGVTLTDTIHVLPLDCRVTVTLKDVDLIKTAVTPGNDDLVEATITNIGTAPCPQTPLNMHMFNSATAVGAFTTLPANTLDALAPNQATTRGFVWRPVRASGPRTFQLLFGAGYPGIAATDTSLFLSLTAQEVNKAAGN